MSKRRPMGLILLCGLVLMLGSVVSGWAAEDRTGELSGNLEVEKKTTTGAPVVQEPEATIPSKSNTSRPALKMPEVVVKGERQFRVSSERKELLMMDPMSGTKEIPSDLAAVSIPGLDTQKGAPLSETHSAKNYLLLLEAAAGTHRQVEGRVAAGQEFENINYFLQGEYAAGAYPAAYGFVPFGQHGDANLDIRLNPTSDSNILLTLLGQGETQTQPQPVSVWGERLERMHTGAMLQGDLALGSRVQMSASGSFRSFLQRGGQTESPVLKAQNYSGKIEYEQKVGKLLNEGLSIWGQLELQGQNSKWEQSSGQQDLAELLKRLTVLSRFRLATMVLLDFGVRLEEYQGDVSRNAAHMLGSLSFVLPTGSVFYGQSQPGLQWQPVSEWAYAQPHPGVVSLPVPEHRQTALRAGWRQRWWSLVSSDVAWFREENQATPVWLDMDQDGVFLQRQLERTTANGLEVGLDIHYSDAISQSVVYTYRQADAGSEPNWPYVSMHQMKTEVRIVKAPVEVSLEYRYVDDRAVAPQESAARLSAAHLLGAKLDYEVAPGWTAFTRVENCLGYAWEEWQGYPARGLSGVLGMRVSF